MITYYINAFRKYLSFRGRATRKEYFCFVFFDLFITIASIVVAFSLKERYAVLEKWPQVPCIIYSLISFIPSLALQVRRLHDVGKSELWLLVKITGIGAIVLFIFLLFKKGDEGQNRYGPPSMRGHHRKGFYFDSSS